MISLLAYAKDEPLFRPSNDKNYDNCPALLEYQCELGLIGERYLTVSSAVQTANSLFTHPDPRARSNFVRVWALDGRGNKLRATDPGIYRTGKTVLPEPVLVRTRHPEPRRWRTIKK